jgi:hypothetical protein
VLGEQRLEREQLAHRRALRELLAQLPTQRLVPRARLRHRTAQRERRHRALRDLAQVRELPRLQQCDERRRPTARGGTQLARRRRHVVQDHQRRVRRVLAGDDADVGVIVRVAERAERATGIVGRGRRARDDRDRRRIEVVEQSPQGRRARRGRDAHVLHGHRPSRFHCWRFADAPGAAHVALDEGIRRFVRTRHDERACRLLRHLRHQRLERGAVLVGAENHVRPREHDRPQPLELQCRRGQQLREVRRRPGDGDGRARPQQAHRAPRARGRDHPYAPFVARQPLGRLRDRGRRLRVGCDDEELRLGGGRIGAVQRRGEEGVDGAPVVRQGQHDIGVAGHPAGLTLILFHDPSLTKRGRMAAVGSAAEV